MDVLGEIHEYSTAEFLAREDGFSQRAIAPYIEQAQQAIGGTGSGLSEETIARIRLHRLLLEDKEEEFLASRPELKPEFAHADSYQLAMASSPHNLDHFIEHGVEYKFDVEKRDSARSIVAASGGLAMQALMREKILSLSGFDGVSINFIFHDALDHAWLFNFMREHALDQKYADFIVPTGNPFEGHLMSREAELLSGIGFTSRRFLSDENYYGRLAMQPLDLASLAQSKNTDGDPRVEEAIGFIIDDEAISAWAGFVVKATISNLILQRERWGGVKELTLLENGDYTPTGNIISLTDPRYLAMIIETVHLLGRHKEEYIKQELALNDTVESILLKFLNSGEAIGSIPVLQCVDANTEHTVKRFGLSTNHFSSD
jgi:hypothetical protein